MILIMRLVIALTTALTSTLLLAACGSDSDGSDGPTVAATTGILADITERVAGEDAEVYQLIPDGSSPHDFELSAKDRAEVEDSVLLVHNGAGLETGVPIEDIDVEEFALAEHAGPLLEAEEGGGHAAEEHTEGDEDHEHEGGDPHVWMDPARTAEALPALGEALAEADPEHAESYRSRSAAYARELEALDAEIELEVAAIPPASRELVTSHDALGYFARRYGFEMVATAFPATGADAEASAGRIDEVVGAIEAAGVPVVFAEAEDDPEVLELIADEAGVDVVTDLLVESPGPTGSYEEMLRHDARLISRGLGGAPEDASP